MVCARRRVLARCGTRLPARLYTDVAAVHLHAPFTFWFVFRRRLDVSVLPRIPCRSVPSPSPRTAHCLSTLPGFCAVYPLLYATLTLFSSSCPLLAPNIDVAICCLVQQQFYQLVRWLTFIRVFCMRAYARARCVNERVRCARAAGRAAAFAGVCGDVRHCSLACGVCSGDMRRRVRALAAWRRHSAARAGWRQRTLSGGVGAGSVAAGAIFSSQRRLLWLRT